MKLDLTRTLGALSLSALALMGCQSGGDAGKDDEAAATAESTCSGRESEKKNDREQDGGGGH